MTLTTSLAMNIAAVVLYLCGSAYLISSALHKQASNSQWLISFALTALAFHGVGGYQMMFTPEGLNLGFYKIGALIFWVINLLVLVSGLRKPLHTLFIFLFPLSAFAILMATFSESSVVTQPDNTILAHILLSVLAYSLLIIATLQALLLAFQNYQLKHKHPTGLIRILPPLQTMEALFFELLWTGQALLTLSIVTGFIFIDNLFAQHLVHKTVLSMLAWCIYAILLWGHMRLGWRGNTAIRWSLGGFVALMLAYFGSKFVLEILLS
jgi:ABC-type uncharacterized transport system permease subunit